MGKAFTPKFYRESVYAFSSIKPYNHVIGIITFFYWNRMCDFYCVQMVNF